MLPLDKRTFNDCFVAEIPPGESGFIFQDNLYYTPVNCCDCPLPSSSFDTQNCFVLDIPDNSIGFIHNNRFYITPPLDFTHVDYTDEIWGYSPVFIENEILTEFNQAGDYSELFALRHLRTILLNKSKPSGVYDKNINLYFESFLDNRE